MTPIYPQKCQILPPKWQFQAKMMKYESPSISATTKPMDLKISHNVKNVKYLCSQMQYDDVTTNPIWRMAAILKIDF